MLWGQAPGVPVYQEGRGARQNAAVRQKMDALIKQGGLLDMKAVESQMKRAQCKLELPSASQEPLESRELWKRARAAHLRIGWYYLCGKCDRWHTDLAGGYAITKSEAATCAHVVSAPEMKEGYFVAVDEEDRVFPVAEVLACNVATDCAILRLKTDQLSPLPLGTDVVPGDEVVCFSEPEGRRGFYSEGHVNRFTQRPFLRGKERKQYADAGFNVEVRPVWMSVSTDWAPGSSGSAVIDLKGNIVGHVSEIETLVDDPPEPAPKANAEGGKKQPEKPAYTPGTTIVFHDAIVAREVMALVGKK